MKSGASAPKPTRRTATLLNAVRDLPLPPSGDGYVRAAGEALSMRAVRQHLTGERGVDKSRIRAAALEGAAAVHETLED